MTFNSIEAQAIWEVFVPAGWFEEYDVESISLSDLAVMDELDTNYGLTPADLVGVWRLSRDGDAVTVTRITDPGDDVATVSS